MVNGCRVRMDHRHNGKKFKSKIRPWYAFQNPRVGRDVKRDKNPDKIPWDSPMMEEPMDEDLLVSNDTTGMPYDEFMDDPFMSEEDSADFGTDSFVAEDTGKKKKKKKRRKGEEEEEVQKVKTDPWYIENVSDEPEEEEEEILPEEETEEGESTEKQDKSKKTKKDRKKEKEEERQRQEELEKEWEEEEEEEDDDWGF